MIGQLANIAGLKLDALKPTEITPTGKPLPSVNSIVEINVIGKTEGTYRLLIDGNVFQSKLPINLTAGELLLAKVISANPFTLSIDNLLAIKNLNAGILSQILSKLHIRESEMSQRLLKKIIGMKKPVIKSKLERLLDCLEGGQANLDEQQLSFLVQVMNYSDKTYDYLDESFVKLFEYPTGDLSAVIFSSVKSLYASELPEDLKSLINKELVLHFPEDGIVNAEEIKAKAGLSPELLESLSKYEKNIAASELQKAETSRLKAALLKYELIRANYEKLGSFPEFIIVENTGELSLFEYRIDKAGGGKYGSGKSTGSYAFDIELMPDSLGEISMSGYLAGESLKVNIASDESVRNLLENEKEKLLERLTNNTKLDASVEVTNKGIDKNTAVMREGMLNVNVRV